MKNNNVQHSSGNTALLAPSTIPQLAKLERARQMLAEARTLAEVKQVRNIAEAARIYVKVTHLGRESQNFAAEIAVRAQRKAGEILGQLEKAQGGSGHHHPPASVAGGSEYRRILEETQTPERTAQRWQTIASIPERNFEKVIRETIGMGEELTTARMLKLAKPEKSKPLIDVFSEIEKLLTPLLPEGADGQLKLAELLESAPKVISPDNSWQASEVCSLLRMIAKHFTDSALKIEAASRNKVARVA